MIPYGMRTLESINDMERSLSLCWAGNSVNLQFRLLSFHDPNPTGFLHLDILQCFIPESYQHQEQLMT
ncbi:hypothetical protein SCLCIDRAFT_1216437 [Scleroderma citrinum Foug A]|uniref:Uncharacterized protein n=1 Tax=Scleroderma citrinum Foug A TaxID=1036808 RepID=A0A0C3DJP9_9AGAM|nr:hypothetical protein SCLCIDRAFT_1216437 [Scleroderma citrinum Foug A]